MAVGDIFCVAEFGNRHWKSGMVQQSLRVRKNLLHQHGWQTQVVDLVFEPGKAVYMSKRDVHTCFDVLAAPSAIQPWFGRPPVSLAELSQVSGLSVTELQGFVVDMDDMPVKADQW